MCVINSLILGLPSRLQIYFWSHGFCSPWWWWQSCETGIYYLHSTYSVSNDFISWLFYTHYNLISTSSSIFWFFHRYPGIQLQWSLPWPILMFKQVCLNSFIPLNLLEVTVKTFVYRIYESAFNLCFRNQKYPTWCEWCVCQQWAVRYLGSIWSWEIHPSGNFGRI